MVLSQEIGVPTPIFVIQALGHQLRRAAHEVVLQLVLDL